MNFSWGSLLGALGWVGSCLRRNDGWGRVGSCLRRNDGEGAGMTDGRVGSCLRRNDESGRRNDGLGGAWVPACAGMTGKAQG